MQVNENVVTVESLADPETWYIFRNNGAEVTIKRKFDNNFSSDYELTGYEINFIKWKLSEYKQMF